MKKKIKVKTLNRFNNFSLEAKRISEDDLTKDKLYDLLECFSQCKTSIVYSKLNKKIMEFGVLVFDNWLFYFNPITFKVLSYDYITTRRFKKFLREDITGVDQEVIQESESDEDFMNKILSLYNMKVDL